MTARTALLSTLLLALAVPALAQGQHASVAAGEDEAVEAPRARLPLQRFFDVQVSLANVHDSNINHDDEYLRSVGLVPGVGVYFRSSPSDADFEASYEAASHSYSNTDRWDRISHRFLGLYTPDHDGDWRRETEVEVSLAGSSEDRDLSNQYVLTQEVEFRLNRSHRFRGYGRYRLRRYPGESERNANNPQIGVEYDHRLSGGRRVEVGARLDQNRSDNVRRRYGRLTLDVGFRTPLFFDGRDQLRVDVKYRDKRYERLVEIEDDVEVPREDGQWRMQVQWSYPVSSQASVQVGYAFESRISNDIDRVFDAHLFTVSFAYTLWRGGPRDPGPIGPRTDPDRDRD